MTITIVPAAGLGSRFEGLGCKPLIRLRKAGVEKSIIRWVCDELPRPLIVATTNSLKEKIKTEVPYATVISVGDKTTGQADTIRLALNILLTEADVNIVNCDDVFNFDLSILQHIGKALNKETVSVVGKIDSFSDNLSWSYIDKLPNPALFEEHKRISNWAMLGAWWFRSTTWLSWSLTAACMVNKEPYLSHALSSYSSMMRYGNRDIDHFAFTLPLQHYSSLGTPDRIRSQGYEIVG